MSVESTTVQDLFPSARALFRAPEDTRGRIATGVGLLAVLAAVGGILVVGRWVLDWADRNI